MLLALSFLGIAPLTGESFEVDEVLQSMTLEEKVGQLFFSFFYGEELDSATREMIQETKLGNIMYYSWANGLKKPEQVKKLSKQVQTVMIDSVGVPALIAIDQEGGKVFRLGGDFTSFPGNRVLAATGNPELAREVGLAMAQEARAVGIAVNLAPVVDINSNPNNPVIGVRSFGDTPAVVIRFAHALIQGMHEGGVYVTLKHFPGHGNTDVDSHRGLPILRCTKESLYKNELLPFKELHKEADLIMTSHIFFPQIDPIYPASLSPLFLKDILRHEIGFEGIVISDSLVMQGIVPKQGSFEEAFQGISNAAIRAFQAGSDCLILGRLEWATFPDAMTPERNQRMTQRVLSCFTQAVREGKVSEKQVDESVRRILCLKRKVLQQEPIQTELSESFFKKHRELSEKVAKSALPLSSN